MSRSLLVLLALTSFLLISEQVIAQATDPYLTMRDPLALCRLDRSGLAPLRSTYGIGFGMRDDPENPGFRIYAEDTGQGVLTHFFFTTRTPDSLTRIRIYIDGQLFSDAGGLEFYKLNQGLLRPPFDTTIGEARLLDVQIPYHTGFKISYKTTDYQTWYDYVWRPLPNAVVPQVTDPRLESSQREAEKNFADPALFWKSVTTRDTSAGSTVRAGESVELLGLAGPLIVTELRLRSSEYDVLLDSVFLEFRYDGEVTPSFRAPLLSLFGQDPQFRPLHALAMDFTRDSGLVFRLPIPIARRLSLTILNRSHADLQFRADLKSHPMSGDPSDYGYLHAQYSESLPTQYHVAHPVFEAWGSGRYVGLLMGIRNLQRTQVYEGDAMFFVDSNDSYNFHCEGTEDYFNGAQYFSYGDFNSPFGGASDHFGSYYRFHYLDAVEFTKYCRFDFQHGVDNDGHENYRTLAFYYLEPMHFWRDADTVIVGESLGLAGEGFGAHENISVRLDQLEIAQIQADEQGKVDTRISIPRLPSAAYALSLNGKVDPRPLWVSETPLIRITNLPLPIMLQAGDSLRFSGHGFQGQSVYATLNGTVCTGTFSYLPNGSLTGSVAVPKMQAGDYIFQVRSSQLSASAQDPVGIRTTLIFDVEDLPILQGNASYNNVSYLYSFNWRKNAVASFAPDQGRSVDFRFVLPYGDLFDTRVALTGGSQFGNYGVLIDGIPLKEFLTHSSKDLYIDTMSLGEIELTSGPHTLSFRYHGTEPRQTDSLLWADFISLSPKNLNAVKLKTAHTPHFIALSPAVDNMLHVRLEAELTANIPYTILDVTGRTVQSGSIHFTDASESSIRLSKLPSAPYLLLLQDPTQMCRFWVY